MPVITEILQPRFVLDIRDDYRLMTEVVLPRFGCRNPEAAGVPTLEQVQAGIAAAGLSGWLEKRAQLGGVEDKLVISRTTGGEHGIGVARTIGRLPYSHECEDRCVWTTLYGDANGEHNPYGDDSTVHDNTGEEGLEGRWDTAILLGDVIDPATGKEAHYPGLVYTGKDVKQQLAALLEEASELHATHDIAIVTAPIGQLATDYVALQEEGKVSRKGITRLIHYPSVTAGGLSLVPAVNAYGKHFYFIDSKVPDACYRLGVQRMVRVPIQPIEA